MGRLTEDLIYAKTKISNIQRVRKLNCWGCQIDDISLLNDMTGVEVLSLSRNDISSLGPISGCVSLEELYLRENKISEIDEIYSLQNLPNLRILWLADNPVAETPEYRKKVLRILPNLERLDDINVSKEELMSCHSVEPKPEEPPHSAPVTEPQPPVEWSPPVNQQMSNSHSESFYSEHYSPAPMESSVQSINRSSTAYSEEVQQYQRESEDNGDNCCETDNYLDNYGNVIEAQEDDYEEIYETKEVSPPNCVSHKSVETDWPQAEECQHNRRPPQRQPPPNVRMSQSAYVFASSRSQTPTRLSNHSVPVQMRQSTPASIPTRCRNDQSAEFRPVRNNNVLAAILTLLNELDPAGLRLVMDEAQARLTHY